MKSGDLFSEKTDKLADPEHKRRGADYYGPVDSPQRNNVEELSADAHYHDLAHKYKRSNHHEATAALEMEG